MFDGFVFDFTSALTLLDLVSLQEHMIEASTESHTDKGIQNVQRDICSFITKSSIKVESSLTMECELASHPVLCEWESQNTFSDCD